MADYMPKGEPELLLWFQNFATKLPGYAATLGITAPELAVVAGDLLLIEATLQSVAMAKQDLKEWISFKDAELYGPVGGPNPAIPGSTPIAISARPPGMMPRTRTLINKLKVHANYTAIIGADLGIEGSGGGSEVLKPVCSVTSSGDFSATIKFKKFGHDGVDVYCQRAGESVWTHLAFDAFSPYVDNRPPLVAGQPEERRYRVRYRDGETAVGEYSDVVTITVGP